MSPSTSAGRTPSTLPLPSPPARPIRSRSSAMTCLPHVGALLRRAGIRTRAAPFTCRWPWPPSRPPQHVPSLCSGMAWVREDPESTTLRWGPGTESKHRRQPFQARGYKTFILRFKHLRRDLGQPQVNSLTILVSASIPVTRQLTPTISVSSRRCPDCHDLWDLVNSVQVRAWKKLNGAKFRPLPYIERTNFGQWHLRASALLRKKLTPSIMHGRVRPCQ